MSATAQRFIERCEHPDGNRVIASGLCELREGQIQRATMLHAWDGWPGRLEPKPRGPAGAGPRT